MGKGKRKREREEKREGKGRLIDLERKRREKAEREQIGREAVENGKRARAEGKGPKVLLDPHREEIEAAQMKAWRAAGSPSGPGAA